MNSEIITIFILIGFLVICFSIIGTNIHMGIILRRNMKELSKIMAFLSNKYEEEFIAFRVQNWGDNDDAII